MLGLSCLLIFSSVKAWGLPWIQIPAAKSKSAEHTVEKNYLIKKEMVNFSGNWKGECNNQPVADLSVEQQSERIVLKYGFMEEKYFIGELKSEAASKWQQSEAGTSLVIWNKENNVLVFINTQHFMNEKDHLNVFFSKVSMSLNGGNLIINGEYFQSANEPGEVTRETVICTYHRK